MRGLFISGEIVHLNNAFNGAPYSMFIVTFKAGVNERKSRDFFTTKPIMSALETYPDLRHDKVGQIYFLLSEDHKTASLIYPEPFLLPGGKGIGRECQLRAGNLLREKVPAVEKVNIIRKVVPIDHLLRFLRTRVVRDRTHHKSRYQQSPREKKQARGRRIRKIFLRKKP